jgi:leucyl-tRNA synthetase
MTTEAQSEAETDLSGRYDPTSIEPKWRARWEADDLYRTPDHVEGKENRYHLTMLPYPSGDLHVGHWFAMTPSDALARYYRMRGYNVLFPMGFDAFGLPAENAAFKGDAHPRDWTDANVAHMREQLKAMGAMFDWSREMNSSQPDYYRWTQWWFLKLYERGLAERKKAPVNWCPTDHTVLANEQVVNGRCERCDSLVEQRELEQWFFKITDYAEELLDNEDLDWVEHVKLMQRNWIGRSEGSEASFALESPAPDGTEEVRVFTTRPDTLFGVTFMVLAPEHPLVQQITTDDQRAEIDAYVEQARRATEIERQSTEREKTGVFTGAYCVNRLNGERVPIWIADYALATYGTGAVMAVPAHDQRDFDFATKFGLPIREVIAGPDGPAGELSEAYTDPGVLVNSSDFDGTPNEEAKTSITARLADEGWGGVRVQYRLRDWLISRQRYWGAPIPMVYCDSCGIQPVPEDQLPVVLPYDVEFRPTGESPLGLSEEFVSTVCPNCDEPARRETDTMDTFMCSSWYYMRYCDPQNAEAAISSEAAQAWLPIDQYTGGSEHAVMHLLYSRFFYKAARDMGLVPGDEPFTRYYSQGQILGPDGRRMSKSRGNVVPPDDQVAKWGADCFRAYLMFLGPWDQGGPFDVDGIVGVARWLNRLWNVVTSEPAFVDAPDGDAARVLRRATHQTIARVTSDIEEKAFNTMVSALMELTNTLHRAREAGDVDRAAWDEAIDSLLLTLAPLCPHVAEELWEQRGRPYSIHQQSWPESDAALAVEELVEIPVQVNGKVRDHVEVAPDADEATVRAAAEALPRWAEHLGGKEPARVIYVPGRMLNVVVK